MLLYLPKWLLVAVLVVGQTTLLAHQSDLDAHSDSADNCVVCHIASGMDGISTCTPTHAVNRVRGEIQPPIIATAFYPAFTQLPRSRAPPVIHVNQILS